MEIIPRFRKNSFEEPVQWTTHLFPLAGVLLYMFYPRSLRISNDLLHKLSVIHNSLLVVFSAWTFVSLSMVLYENGIVFSTAYYFQKPFFDFLILSFYLSKYYEFFDTFLLYLKGKNPIFLQKFHHIGAVIVWHLCYVYKVDAIWISTLVNSFVHTIMYSYYLGCLLQINQVRRIKQYITSMQLVQLCIPSCVAVWCYYPPIETPFNYAIILFFVGYVGVLVYLFGQFYFANYININPEKKIANKDIETLVSKKEE
jgi:hypothetical protein